jgi:putative ABC transport system permease protein
MNAWAAATRIYQLTLTAFPPRHRGAYAAEMVDTFERELAAQRRDRGAWRALWFVLSAWLNVIGAGLGERRRQRRAGFTAATGFSWIDVTLAWRMLVRYPGLSVVGVLGIAIAAGAFSIVSALIDPVLPFEDGDRLVSFISWDTRTHNREQRMLRDFAAWRSLTTVEDIGASRTVARNLIAQGGPPETVAVAEISASAFRLARVSPSLGRHLLPEDEAAGAPDALVIGHDVWVRRFAADPGIIGRPVQLGATTYAVVGVMPDGFGFPLNHSWWVPWRLDPELFEPRNGPAITVFARLAPGVTMQGAQSELTTVAQRLAVASPSTHEQLLSRVVPYTAVYTDMDDSENVLALRAIQTAIVLLLVLVCVNVSILVYARTATRQGEIAVRSALGASRRRIVAQLFVEALVLASVAAIAGFAIVSVVFSQLAPAVEAIGGQLPFWMSFRLSTNDIIYVAGLTLLAAAIVGVAPALKATGRQVQTRLQGLSAGSGSRMQMGRLWTLLIVAQVGLTVALLPATMFHAWNSLRFRTGDAGFASGEFLTSRLALDGTAEFDRVQSELERRLLAEPPVHDVTFSMVGPGGELALVLEVENQPPPIDPVNYNIVEGTKQGHLIRFNRVATDFFDVFEVPMVMGRGFDAGDTGTGPGVIINRSMAEQLFGGASPLGQRVRYVGRSRETAPRDVELNRWYEIVGVVQDFPTLTTLDVQRVNRVYHAAAPGALVSPMMAVRVRFAKPTTFAGRLREVAAAVDPNLQLRDLTTSEEAMKREQGLMRLIGITISLVMISVIVLSAAGIYALMSFTVARRRREIGIRVALGADPAHILAGVFSRAFAQLAIGAGAGMLGAVALEGLLEGELFQGQGAVILPIVVVLMTTVGLLAAIGPARRGLRVQPTEALREE